MLQTLWPLGVDHLKLESHMLFCAVERQSTPPRFHHVPGPSWPHPCFYSLGMDDLLARRTGHVKKQWVTETVYPLVIKSLTHLLLGIAVLPRRQPIGSYMLSETSRSIHYPVAKATL